MRGLPVRIRSRAPDFTHVVPLAQIKMTNHIILGPRPSPAHGGLVAKPYEDGRAWRKWGWKRHYGLVDRMDSFLEEQAG